MNTRTALKSDEALFGNAKNLLAISSHKLQENEAIIIMSGLPIPQRQYVTHSHETRFK